MLLTTCFVVSKCKAFWVRWYILLLLLPSFNVILGASILGASMHMDPFLLRSCRCLRVFAPQPQFHSRSQDHPAGGMCILYGVRTENQNEQKLWVGQCQWQWVWVSGETDMAACRDECVPFHQSLLAFHRLFIPSIISYHHHHDHPRLVVLHTLQYNGGSVSSSSSSSSRSPLSLPLTLLEGLLCHPSGAAFIVHQALNQWHAEQHIRWWLRLKLAAVLGPIQIRPDHTTMLNTCWKPVGGGYRYAVWNK